MLASWRTHWHCRIQFRGNGTYIRGRPWHARSTLAFAARASLATAVELFHCLPWCAVISTQKRGTMLSAARLHYSAFCCSFTFWSAPEQSSMYVLRRGQQAHVMANTLALSKHTARSGEVDVDNNVHAHWRERVIVGGLAIQSLYVSKRGKRVKRDLETRKLHCPLEMRCSV